jgi:hypothetical protein
MINDVSEVPQIEKAVDHCTSINIDSPDNDECSVLHETE